MRIIHVDYTSPETQEIVNELQEYYSQVLGFTYTSIDDTELNPPSGTFILALEGDVVIGCSGYKIHPGNKAELKKLYAKPAYRGQGVALTMLQSHAYSHGLTMMTLTTHSFKLPNALSFYRSAGYKKFGHYSKDPPLKMSLPVTPLSKINIKSIPRFFRLRI